MNAHLHPPGMIDAHRWTRRLPALALVLLALIVTACGGPGASPVPTTSPAELAPPLVKLPEDEGAHSAGVEWWYFNGHLTDESKREYSFHFVTFQTRIADGATGRLLQLSWGDHANGLYLTAEKAALATAEATPGRFDFQDSGWRMSGDGTGYALSFDTGGYFLDLQATSRKPAVLHQGTGLVKLGPAGNTFYYSRPRLDVSGTLTIDGQPLRVNGAAWMDHQWGEFTSRQVGWDWMSIQLDDGSELMAALVWDPDGHQPFASYGTFITGDGAVRRLEEEDFRLTPAGSWTSPATGTVYPMGWDFSAGLLDLALTLTPVQQDAEFSGSRYAPADYWEGAVSVAGTLKGSPVTGKGFVELVGYASP